MEKKLIELTINNTQDSIQAMKDIGTTLRGIDIMKEKLVFRVFKLTNVDTRAANILKQTMLSQGAEAAVSAATINLSQSATDVIIGANLHQLRLAVQRLKEQPWGLKAIAKEIEDSFLS